jgi:hypothetical protein
MGLGDRVDPYICRSHFDRFVPEYVVGTFICAKFAEPSNTAAAMNGLYWANLDKFWWRVRLAGSHSLGAWQKSDSRCDPTTGGECNEHGEAAKTAGRLNRGHSQLPSFDVQNSGGRKGR